MNYQQTLDYLFAQLPMFTRIGAAAYKADLTNTIALCNFLQNPQHQFKSIHIAGTNGKGSTSNLLAAIFQKAGYKTGLYTSPHIHDFRERIRIDGKMISEEFVVDFVEKTKIVSESIQPSFFELTVAMAFNYFADEKVDIAIIETGLGGRLDSTNVIFPELSVITNIGFDHVNLLGNTLEAIAKEKAGIIKSNTPVVIGEFTSETRKVFEAKATEMNAPILFAEEIFTIDKYHVENRKMYCYLRQNNETNSQLFVTDLAGNYQANNLRTVLSFLPILIKKGFQIPSEIVHEAIAEVHQLTGFKGRWDILQESPTIICDVAHNIDGIQQVLLQLQQSYSRNQWHFVLGFVKDKDVAHVLDLFPTDAKYYFTQAHIPRAFPVEELQQMAKEKHLLGDSFENINDAVKAAINNANNTDVIMICGSFFTLAEMDILK